MHLTISSCQSLLLIHHMKVFEIFSLRLICSILLISISKPTDNLCLLFSLCFSSKQINLSAFLFEQNAATFNHVSVNALPTAMFLFIMVELPLLCLKKHQSQEQMVVEKSAFTHQDMSAPTGKASRTVMSESSDATSITHSPPICRTYSHFQHNWTLHWFSVFSDVLSNNGSCAPKMSTVKTGDSFASALDAKKWDNGLQCSEMQNDHEIKNSQEQCDQAPKNVTIGLLADTNKCVGP